MSEHGELADILRDGDNLLVQAVPVPNEGVMDSDQRQRVMEAFSEYINGHGITPRDVGRQLGKPRSTTIMDLQRGIYREQTDEHIRRLNMWMEQHARANAAQLGDRFVTTKVATAILNVARLTAENQTCSIVVGPTGIGKSRCAQAIHETYVGSIYIRIMNGYHHPRGLALALAEKTGVRQRMTGTNRQNSSIVERVIEALRDTHRLILLDEAQLLTDSALSAMRDVHDCTGCPFMLLGTRDLLERIQRNVGPDHGQLYSRFDIVTHVTQGCDVYNGGKALFTVDEIRQLYQVTPIKLAGDAAHYLRDVANHLGSGSLRRCKILLRNAARRARKRQKLGDDDRVTVLADDLEWVEGRLRQESSEVLAATNRRHKMAVSR